MSSKPPTNKTRRRWYDQKIRYLTNRAVYIVPHEQLSFFLPFLNTIPDFAETTALYKLLIYGQVDEILFMPGAAATAGARLLQERQKHLGEIEYNGEVKDYIIETLGTFMLYDICTTSKSVYTRSSWRDQTFLNFCAGNSSEQRQLSDFSYLDEIQTLQLSRSRSDNFDMLRTKFSFLEDEVFDALDIGGGYFS